MNDSHEAETPEQVLWKLWRQGHRPELRAFVEQQGPLSVASLADLILIDQHERWSLGERVPVEDYFHRWPQLVEDDERACDLIYGEFLLREQLGETPEVEEYRTRFPTQAERLLSQVQLHRAFSLADADADTGMDEGPPPTAGRKTGPRPDDSRGPATVSMSAVPDPFRPHIPGFDIREEIGRGGMGVVYKARQVSLDRTVALKMIRVGPSPRAGQKSGIPREARLTARLQHPHIVTIYDIGTTADGSLFFFMEYVPGVDLHRLVERKGPLPVDLACSYIRQAALGLQHAHEHGVIHRDIKPSNLMVTGSESDPDGGVVKILDLGLARLMGDPVANLPVPEAGLGTDLPPGGETDSLATMTGSFVGTPDFVAPEQASSPRSVDARSDLYALGCTFFYLLTGGVPFAGPTPLAKLVQHRLEEPPPLQTLRSGIPVAVENIVNRLMAKLPEDRYPSAASLARALFPFTREGQRTPELLARVRGHDDQIRGLALVPAGNRLASVGLDGTVRLWDVTQGEQLTLQPHRECRGHEGGVLSVAFSPDARKVISGGQDRSLRCWSAEQGTILWMATGHRDTINSVAAGGHGLVASGSADGTVRLWEEGSGAAVRGWAAHRGPVWSVAFSPDGRWIASGGQDRVVRLWDLTGNLVRVLAEQAGPINSVAFSPEGSRLASGATDDRVVVSETAGGKEVACLVGHEGKVNSVAFVGSGRVLSASRDFTVRLWDLVSGHQSACYREHTRWVTAVAVRADGKQAVSGGADQLICVWRLPE
jgi:serine/threonine protein kinase